MLCFGEGYYKVICLYNSNNFLVVPSFFFVSFPSEIRCVFFATKPFSYNHITALTRRLSRESREAADAAAAVVAAVAVCLSSTNCTERRHTEKRH